MAQLLVPAESEKSSSAVRALFHDIQRRTYGHGVRYRHVKESDRRVPFVIMGSDLMTVVAAGSIYTSGYFEQHLTVVTSTAKGHSSAIGSDGVSVVDTYAARNHDVLYGCNTGFYPSDNNHSFGVWGDLEASDRFASGYDWVAAHPEALIYGEKLGLEAVEALCDNMSGGRVVMLPNIVEN